MTAVGQTLEQALLQQTAHTLLPATRAVRERLDLPPPVDVSTEGVELVTAGRRRGGVRA